MPSLRPAEQRVGEAVLADPAAISESSITTVARQCMTSETPVLRFCRAISLGYPELRIALARARAGGDRPERPPASERDDRRERLGGRRVAKISYADSRAVEETGAALTCALTSDRGGPYGRPDRHLRHWCQCAGRQDLHQKLHRLGPISFSWADSRPALTSAAVLESAMSPSGSPTPADRRHCRRASGRQAARCDDNRGDQPAKSPITEDADVVLTTAARETTFRSGAMASRIAQLALIDCLFTGVAQRSYDHAIDTLETSYAAVQSRHGGRRG
jgi:hypothetical protein